jgi:hypothetical protein
MVAWFSANARYRVSYSQAFSTRLAYSRSSKRTAWGECQGQGGGYLQRARLPRAMKAEGIGATEISKALKIARILATSSSIGHRTRPHCSFAVPSGSVRGSRAEQRWSASYVDRVIATKPALPNASRYPIQLRICSHQSCATEPYPRRAKWASCWPSHIPSVPELDLQRPPVRTRAERSEGEGGLSVPRALSQRRAGDSAAGLLC